MEDAASPTCTKFVVGTLGGFERVLTRDRHHGREHPVVIGAGFAREFEGRRVEFRGAVQKVSRQLDGGDLTRGEKVRLLPNRHEVNRRRLHQPLRKIVSGCSSSLSGNALSWFAMRVLFAMALRRRSNSSSSS